MQKTFSKLKVEITDPKKDSFIIYNDCKVVFNISEIDSSFKVKMKILCDNVLIFSMIDCWDSMDDNHYYLKVFHYLNINNINDLKQDNEIYLYNNTKDVSFTTYRSDDSFGWFNTMISTDYSLFTDSKDLCFMIHSNKNSSDNKLFIQIPRNDELNIFLDTIIKKYAEDLNHQIV
jgi:hypothetical protein